MRVSFRINCTALCHARVSFRICNCAATVCGRPAGRFSERYADRSATSEPVFPAELMLSRPSAVSIVGETVTWHSPTSLSGLLALKAAHPDARIVAGNTEVI